MFIALTFYFPSQGRRLAEEDELSLHGSNRDRSQIASSMNLMKMQMDPQRPLHGFDDDAMDIDEIRAPMEPDAGLGGEIGSGRLRSRVCVECRVSLTIGFYLSLQLIFGTILNIIVLNALTLTIDEEDSCAVCDHCCGRVHLRCVFEEPSPSSTSYFWCSHCSKPHREPSQLINLSAGAVFVGNQYHLAQLKHKDSVDEFRADMGERLERQGENRLPSDNIFVNPEFLYKV